MQKHKNEQVFVGGSALFVNNDQFLSLDEAATFLKISKSTLRKHTSQGKISYYKPNGKLIVFKMSDLIEWIQRGKVPSNDELLKAVANNG